MNLTRGKMQNIARFAMAKGWAVAIVLSVIAGCTPRVEVAAPEKPITINLNVKIDHEIRVKVDKELDQVLSTNNGLF
jgi:YnbE-like lipoprotein